MSTGARPGGLEKVGVVGGGLMGSGIAVPDLESYAATLWGFWEDYLDDSIKDDSHVVRALTGKDTDRLPEERREMLRHHASHGVGAAARRKADDDSHGSLGI